MADYCIDCANTGKLSPVWYGVDRFRCKACNVARYQAILDEHNRA